MLIRLRDSELKAPNKRPLPKVKPNDPLRLFQLATIFIFAAIGLVLSVSMFLMELVIGMQIKAKSARGRAEDRAEPKLRPTVIDRSVTKDAGRRKGDNDDIEVSQTVIVKTEEKGDIITSLEIGEE